MEKVRLSVIVPIYNSEKYLEKCIISILNQSFRSLELILINDGSTDDSIKICNKYLKKDKRVRLVDKSNEGVAIARNTGLNISVGEYITFVDSDDWIELNMYSEMMDIADKYSADIVLCDCIKDFDNHSEVYTHDIREGFYTESQLANEYYPHLLIMENIEYPATISNCLMLFRNNIRTSEIEYLPGVRYSEDLLFGAQIMSQAKSFYYLKNKTFYHYNCANPISATHNPSLDKWNDYLRIYDASCDYFLNISPSFQIQIDKMLLFFLFNTIGELQKADAKKTIKLILNSSVVRSMFRRITILDLPINWKLKIRTYSYKFKMTVI